MQHEMKRESRELNYTREASLADIKDVPDITDEMFSVDASFEKISEYLFEYRLEVPDEFCRNYIKKINDCGKHKNKIDIDDLGFCGNVFTWEVVKITHDNMYNKIIMVNDKHCYPIKLAKFQVHIGDDKVWYHTFSFLCKKNAERCFKMLKEHVKNTSSQ